MNKPVKPEQLTLGPAKPDAVDHAVTAKAEIILAQSGPPDREYDDFDWSEDVAIILRSQPATAVYYNPAGHLVIRQERRWDEEYDPVVLISPENAVTFMEALAKRARE